jgi:hypothetical protein
MPVERKEEYREVLAQIQKFCQKNQQVLGNPSYIPLLDRTVVEFTDYHNHYALQRENERWSFIVQDFLGGNEKGSFKISLESLATTLWGFEINNTTIKYGSVCSETMNPQIVIESFLEGVRRFVREDQIKESNIEGLVDLGLFHIKHDLVNSKQL